MPWGHLEMVEEPKPVINGLGMNLHARDTG